VEIDPIWALVWKLVATCFCVLIFGIASCSMHDNHLRAKLLANTGDPIAMRCAFDGAGERSNSICTIIANRK
jgi:hypothetical protein